MARVITPASCFALVSLACGGEAAYPPPPVPAQLPSAARDVPGVTTAGPLVTPVFTVDPGDPAARAYYLAHLEAPARPLEPVPATTLTARAVLDTSRVEARAAPPPALFGATLAEGERARVAVELEDGACVTAIAHGGLGVMEVDVFVVSGEDRAPTILRDDEKSGPVAVAAGSATCTPAARVCGPVCAAAGAARPRVEVIVRRGGGPVVVGVARVPAIASGPPASPPSSRPPS